MDKTIEGPNIDTFYDLSLHLLNTTIYGLIEGSGDLLSWMREPSTLASQKCCTIDGAVMPVHETYLK